MRQSVLIGGLRAGRGAGNSLLECVVYGRIAGQWSAQTHLSAGPGPPPCSHMHADATVSINFASLSVSLPLTHTHTLALALLAALTPDTYTPLRLRQQRRVGTFSRIFTFDLPSSRHVAGLRVGQYISLRAPVGDGGALLVRSYSPISRTTERGALQLLVKCEDTGHMSVFLAGLQPGARVEVTGPLGNADLDPRN
jgi:hypothetical protein